MKKVLASLLVLFAFMITVPLTEVDAQTRCYRGRSSRVSTARYYRSRTVRPYYATQGYTYQRPSFYRRHRNVINMAIGTGGGAILGGLIGGRRGAGIGALLGAGGSALYTYKLNPKKRRYYR